MKSRVPARSTRAMLSGSNAAIVSAGGLATLAVAACAAPFAPPRVYSPIPHVRLSIVPDSRALVQDVHAYRSEQRTLIMGQLYNQTMLAFHGGRIEVKLLDAEGGTKAEGFGAIQSSLVGPHDSSRFRVSVEYAGSFDACQITVHAVLKVDEVTGNTSTTRNGGVTVEVAVHTNRTRKASD